MIASTSSMPPSLVQRFRVDPPRSKNSWVISEDGEKNDSSSPRDRVSSVVKSFKPALVFEAISAVFVGFDPVLTLGPRPQILVPTLYLAPLGSNVRLEWSVHIKQRYVEVEEPSKRANNA